jgi:hypothetical protein
MHVRQLKSDIFHRYSPFLESPSSIKNYFLLTAKLLFATVYFTGIAGNLNINLLLMISKGSNQSEFSNHCSGLGRCLRPELDLGVLQALFYGPLRNAK